MRARVTVKKQDRRPRAAVPHPQPGPADIDPLQREAFEHDPHYREGPASTTAATAGASYGGGAGAGSAAGRPSSRSGPQDHPGMGDVLGAAIAGDLAAAERGEVMQVYSRSCQARA
jgi:hypothetical protein